MHADKAELLVTALRSGRFKQGFGTLKKNNKHCCLGVACELAVEAGVAVDMGDISRDGHMFSDLKHEDQRSGILPEVVRDWLGMSSCTGEFPEGSDYLSFVGMNDHAMADFNAIADEIEKYAEEL